jgi:hypothetical protein
MALDLAAGSVLAAARPAFIYPFAAAYARDAAAAAAALLGAAAAGASVAGVNRGSRALAFGGALAAAYLLASAGLGVAVRSSYARWRDGLARDACGVAAGMTLDDADRLIQACGRVVLRDRQNYSLEPNGLARLNPSASSARELRIDLGPDGRVARADGAGD